MPKYDRDEPGTVAGETAPAVLIFRKQLLPWSETFIAAQGTALKRYRPIFVGYRRTRAGDAYLAGHALAVLADHALVPPLAKGMYKAFGWLNPAWRRALEAHRPVLLHAHFGGNGAAAIPITRAFDIPLVVTFHGMDIAVRRSKARSQREVTRVFAAAERIVAVSHFIAGKLREAGCPERKLVVHYIGVDTELFSPGDPGVRENARVLFVGRLVEKKGLVHLIRAMRRVRERIPSADLVIAGDGGRRAALAAEADHLGIRCSFLGVQTPEQVRALMRSATVLCAPSVVAASGDAEGLGMVLVEAQACGTPVVAFRSGGAGESIIHGETGFVVPEGDEAALADRITALLADTELCTRLSRQAREHVLRDFDLGRQTAVLECIYDEARQAREANIP